MVLPAHPLGFAGPATETVQGMLSPMLAVLLEHCTDPASLLVI